MVKICLRLSYFWSLIFTYMLLSAAAILEKSRNTGRRKKRGWSYKFFTFLQDFRNPPNHEWWRFFYDRPSSGEGKLLDSHFVLLVFNMHFLLQMTSSDKDFRFMATNDLMSELQKDSIKLDDESEGKVVRMLLKLLEDKNGEVQNLAVRW